MSTWRLLHTWNGAPGWNMGLDEALLLVPQDRPTLRFYSWNPPTLSLGYFQRVADVPAVERAEAVVRRITGGGAIHHDAELTFSIGAAEDHPLYAGEVKRSYERVHAAIARALADYGVRAEERGERSLLSDHEGTGMCFEHSSDVDLVWNERKGVGSAQRRTRGRVLHHGSIKLGRSELDREVAHLERPATQEQLEALAGRVAEELAGAVGITLEPASPTPAELAHADERAAHFTSDAFVRRR